MSCLQHWTKTVSHSLWNCRERRVFRTTFCTAVALAHQRDQRHLCCSAALCSPGCRRTNTSPHGKSRHVAGGSRQSWGLVYFCLSAYYYWGGPCLPRTCACGASCWTTRRSGWRGRVGCTGTSGTRTWSPTGSGSSSSNTPSGCSSSSTWRASGWRSIQPEGKQDWSMNEWINERMVFQLHITPLCKCGANGVKF